MTQPVTPVVPERTVPESGASMKIVGVRREAVKPRTALVEEPPRVAVTTAD
jgi:hypothetical protein